MNSSCEYRRKVLDLNELYFGANGHSMYDILSFTLKCDVEVTVGVFLTCFDLRYL